MGECQAGFGCLLPDVWGRDGRTLSCINCGFVAWPAAVLRLAEQALLQTDLQTYGLQQPVTGGYNADGEGADLDTKRDTSALVGTVRTGSDRS